MLGMDQVLNNDTFNYHYHQGHWMAGKEAPEVGEEPDRGELHMPR